MVFCVGDEHQSLLVALAKDHDGDSSTLIVADEPSSGSGWKRWGWGLSGF